MPSTPSDHKLPLTLIIALFFACPSTPTLVLHPSDASLGGLPATIGTAILPGAGNVTGKPAPPGVNGHLAIVSNAAPHFRAFGPVGGHPCGKRVRTSVTARAHGCRLATNAAPFNMKTGDCDCGVYISNGRVLGSGGWKPSFSVTGDGKLWAIGTLNSSVASSLNVTQSLNGFGWLVRDGANVVPDEPNAYIAPRTAIGVTKSGKLLILEVDGCEQARHCLWDIGKTEFSLAELLIQHGAHHAINLDGGGSSSFVVNGTVKNHPTDFDLWSLKKERAVTVISCIV